MLVSEVGFVYSEHYKNDNIGRETAIRSIGGDGVNVIAKFYVDKHHPEGNEWHWVTDNGIIICTNEYKSGGRLVTTKLIARPQQLTRYLNWGLRNELDNKTRNMRNWLMPSKLIKLAARHQQLGLNYS